MFLICTCSSIIYCRVSLFSIVFPLLLCQRWETIFIWVRFWAFYSIQLISLFSLSLIPHFFDYCSFIVSLEVRWYQSFIFVLPFKYCVGILGLLALHINFRIRLLISTKRLAEILIGIMLIELVRTVILTSYSLTRNISPFI